MLPMFYTLDSTGNPVVERDPKKWADWQARADNEVQTDHVSDEIVVSTIFLGIDAGAGELHSPLLWETIIVGGPQGGYCRRYGSREAALNGHYGALEIAKNTMNGPPLKLLRTAAPLLDASMKEANRFMESLNAELLRQLDRCNGPVWRLRFPRPTGAAEGQAFETWLKTLQEQRDTQTEIEVEFYDE